MPASAGTKQASASADSIQHFHNPPRIVPLRDQRADALVERREAALVPDRERDEVRIGDLLVSDDADACDVGRLGKPEIVAPGVVARQRSQADEPISRIQAPRAGSLPATFQCGPDPVGREGPGAGGRIEDEEPATCGARGAVGTESAPGEPGENLADSGPRDGGQAPDNLVDVVVEVKCSPHDRLVGLRHQDVKLSECCSLCDCIA